MIISQFHHQVRNAMPATAVDVGIVHSTLAIVSRREASMVLVNVVLQRTAEQNGEERARATTHKQLPAQLSSVLKE